MAPQRREKSGGGRGEEVPLWTFGRRHPTAAELSRGDRHPMPPIARFSCPSIAITPWPAVSPRSLRATARRYGRPCAGLVAFFGDTVIRGEVIR